MSDTDTQPTEPLVVLFVNREFKMATIAKQIVVNSNPVHGEVYSIQHYVMSVTCDRSMVFSGYSDFLHQ